MKMLPVASLKPHPRNVREGDVGAFAMSLSEFGQYRPIVVQDATPEGEARMVILAGNHTWRAAKSLGWEVINAVTVTVDDKTALRIMLADNRTHDLGRDKAEELVALLTELAEEDLLPGTGWDGDDLDRLLTEADSDVMFREASSAVAPAAEEDEFGDVRVRIGPYNWVVTRSEWERWEKEVKEKAGYAIEEVVIELRARLEL